MYSQTKQQKLHQQYLQASVVARLSGKHYAKPDDKGRWNTKAKKIKTNPSTRYTPKGPSKKTLGKRSAKALRGRSRNT